MSVWSGKKYAVFIAIDQYNDAAGVDNLQGCKKDANYVLERLVTSKQYDYKPIELKKGTSVLSDKEATHEGIQQLFEKCAKKVNVTPPSTQKNVRLIVKFEILKFY